MALPYDVRGVYDAPAHEVGEQLGHKLGQSVPAWVPHNQVTSKAKEPPEENTKNAAVYSKKKKDPIADYTSTSTATATVTINSHGNYGEGAAPSPIMFTNFGIQVKCDAQGGGKESTLYLHLST